MITKTILSGMFVMFALVISLNMVSAISFGNPSSDHPLNSLTPNDNVTVRLTNDDEVNQTITLSFSDVGFADIADLHTNYPDPFPLNIGESVDIEISVDAINSNLAILQTTTALLTASSDAENVTDEEVEIEHWESFCVNGPARDDILEITNVNVNNLGDNEDSDDDKIFPFDEVEIEIEVENTGDEDLTEDDLEDIQIEIGLFDSAGLVNEIDSFTFNSDDDEKEKLGDMDPDDEESFTFELRLEDSDEDLDGNFNFVVKVYDKNDEQNVCSDYSDDLDNNNKFSQDIELDREKDEDRFIRFTDIIVPEQVTCGETIQVRATAVNIGDDKVEKLNALLFSNELGLDLAQTIRGDISEGDQEKLTFDFTVPEDVDDKTYTLTFTSEYEVSDDFETSDIDERVPLKVIGCEFEEITQNLPSVSISASLGSEAEAGEELVVDARITNSGSQRTTISVNARGYESWADLNSLSPRLVTLEPGQSQAVTLTLQVGEEVTGSQSLLIETNADGRVEVQEVEVNIAGEVEETSEPFEFDFGGNGLIWIIAIINIILIVLIIVVAVRLARR